MIRLTRKVFTDLSIWMLCFGLLMGMFFPFFAVIMGIPVYYVITVVFFAACVMAGLIVGITNIRLVRVVVGQRLRILSDRMHMVASNLTEIIRSGDLERCKPEHCFITVDSDDEIGESAKSFNNLVKALAVSLQTEVAIRSFSEMLSSKLEVGEMAEKALEQLMKYTKATAGAILIETEGELHVTVSQGIRSTDTLVKSDYLHRALRSLQRQTIVLPEDVILEGVLTDFRPREVIIEPILYKEVVLGAIILANATGFSEEEQSLLDLFRQGLALSLHNALLYDRLERLAALDPLTGAYNRRFGMARLHEEFGRAVRGTLPLGVLMFDLDHFKNVNDTYGHLAGDRVLVRISKLARSVIREGDILIRYGGEEFLVILPGASKNDINQVAERLRRIVEEATIADNEQAIRVTVSVGGVAFPEIDVEDETKLVHQADKALYTAKESGRNQVVLV